MTDDLAQGLAEDEFVHFLLHGPNEPPPPVLPAADGDATTLFLARARAMSVLHARAKLDFRTDDAPALSVIMTPRDHFPLTLMTLGSLRANVPGGIDLVLIDRGSADETRDIERYVLGATRFRFDTDIGLAASVEAALQFAGGEKVLYLASGVELAPGAVAAAARRLDDDAGIGAVGGMVLGAGGQVEEAGGIVWRDGSVTVYGRNASPLAPEVNFVRDVDFCSRAFLLARRALLNALGGFDRRFEVPAYADADLCLRMREAGHRVVYDPGVCLYRVRAEDAGGDSDRSMVDAARDAFVDAHASRLGTHADPEEQTPVFARMADATRRRVLFVEDTVPLRMIGSGYVRSNDIIRVMAGLGYAVTVYPINGNRFDVAAVHADMPDTVEVMHESAQDGFQAFLEQRHGYYDAIWVARTHNLTTVRRALERVHAGRDSAPPLVLDTEALASVRDARKAAQEGQPFDLDAALRRELADAAFCETVVTINEAEAGIVRALGFGAVAVIGHQRPLRPTPRPFAQRAGMLFVGAIHGMDSPNYDSLCWFVDEVLPLIGRELTWQTRLTVAGYTAPGVNLDRFRDHPRVTLRGAVTDLEPLYDSHRVFVAPTRIAAGVPYKVHEAASFGLPVVATELLREQLGWAEGKELLAAETSDPAGFAGRVIASQRDEVLWQRLRDSALERLRQENNSEDYAAAITGVLGSPRAAR